MPALATTLRTTMDPSTPGPGIYRKLDRAINMTPAPKTDSQRHFALQPIFTGKRRIIGYESLFRAGWEDVFSGDPDVATQTMIDNWLLFGFEDLTAGCFTFLNCTRATLMSGLLPLLPRWAVFEILETVEPDDEVLRVCRELKSLGYGISLDDFDSPERMKGFLHLADFIKIDFRLSNSKERARLLRHLRETDATLIAEKIETEEEFRQASLEGFDLFQGNYFPERASFAMNRDTPHPINCLRIADELHQPRLAEKRLTELIFAEPGIAGRILRRANWITAPGNPVNSLREAIGLLGRHEVIEICRLAMITDAHLWDQLSSYFEQSGIFAGGAVTGNRSVHVRPDLQSGDGIPPSSRMREAQPGKVIKMSTLRARTDSGQ